MAIDKTKVAVHIAALTVARDSDLANALEDFEDFLEWGTDAGINFNDYEGEFAGNSELKHVDGAMLNQLLLNVAPGIVSYLESNTVSAGPYEDKTYMEIVQMVRRS
jgi:hypothetical protein